MANPPKKEEYRREASEAPVQESKQISAVEEALAAQQENKLPEKSIYAVDELDVKHFKEHKLKEEKQRSLDAIEQSIRDACKITEDKIRKDPTVVALTEDPGDVEKRLAFLRKFGPSNVKPPRPAPTEYGIKDIPLMEWMAKYEPAEFLKYHADGRSEVAKRLLKSIRQSA